MNIISSIIQWKLLQIDGSFNVREMHTDNLGATYALDYFLDKQADPNAHLTASAAQLLLTIPAQEIANNINAVITLGSLAIPTLNYSTAAQNIAALRLDYQSSTKQQAIFIGDFLNSLTDTQLENAFGLTANQVTSLRASRLTPAAANAAAIRAAEGQ